MLRFKFADGGPIGPLQTKFGTNRIGRKFMQSANITAPAQSQAEPQQFSLDLNGIKSGAFMPAPKTDGPLWGNLVNLDGTPYQKSSSGPYASKRKAVNWDKVNAFANETTPYLSNIFNSFRKPPMPAAPVFNTFTNLTRANYGTERDAVARRFVADNKSIERNLDGNTAEAVKRFNRGQEEAAISAVNDRENKDNMTIGNQQAVMDSGIKAMNTNLVNTYMNSGVERDIAHQREQSANMANAGEKATLIGNEKRKADVDMQKTRVLATAYSTSGVYDRLRRKLMKQSGIVDPTGQDYKDLVEEDKKAEGGKKSANGGFLHRLIKLN